MHDENKNTLVIKKIQSTESAIKRGLFFISSIVAGIGLLLLFMSYQSRLNTFSTITRGRTIQTYSDLSEEIIEIISLYKDQAGHFDQNNKEFNTKVDNLNKMIVSKFNILKSFENGELLSTINHLENNYIEMNKKVGLAIKDLKKNNDLSHQSYQNFIDSTEKLRNSLNFQKESIYFKSIKINKKNLRMINTIIVICLFVLLVSFILSYFLIKYLIRSISNIVNLLAKERETIYQQEGLLKNKIENVVQKLLINSNKLKDSSNKLAQHGNVLNSSSTEQAAATEQAVTSIEEILAMVNQTFHNSERSSQAAHQCQEKVISGKEVINSMSVAMHDIHESNKELNTIIQLIDQIASKTKIINDIVIKTELLSFNASIEAARAAEYGKGFAVVAEEVGNLARLSGQSANEIEELLSSTSLHVSKIIDGINQKIKVGDSTTGECVLLFNQIYELNHNVNGLIDSTVSAGREQQKGLEQTSHSITRIDRATQTNLQITSETLDQASLVQEQSNDLSQSISLLKEILTKRQEDKNIDSNSSFNHPLVPEGLIEPSIFLQKEPQDTIEEEEEEYKKAVGED